MNASFYTQKRGFTVFFAVLVSSLALAIGLAIYDLLIRELALSQTAEQSQYAIYAADMGAECALYWDSKYGGSGSAFGTTSASTWGTSPLSCNGQDITTQGPPAADWSQYVDSNTAYNCPSTPGNAWCIATGAKAATTTFRVITSGSGAISPCALVTVAKSAANSGDPSQTTIVSHGYNTCSATGIVRLERALQVSY
jgi:hypothetical protein